MREWAVVVMAATSVLGLAACGSSTGSSSQGKRFATGAAIARALDQQLTDTQNNPITATCPDERMAQGDKITCRARFIDGSYHEVAVTLTGFDGSVPKIRVDVP